MQSYNDEFDEELSKPDCNLIELYEYCVSKSIRYLLVNYLIDKSSINYIKEIIYYHSEGRGRYASLSYKETFYSNLVYCCINSGRLDVFTEVLVYMDDAIYDPYYSDDIVRWAVGEFKRKGFIVYLRKLFVLYYPFKDEVMSNEKIQF